MLEDDPGVAVTAGPCRIDVGNFPNRKCVGTDHPCASGYERNGDRKKDIQGAGSKNSNHRQSENDQREGHENVHYPLENQVEFSTEISTGDS